MEEKCRDFLIHFWLIVTQVTENSWVLWKARTESSKYCSVTLWVRPVNLTQVPWQQCARSHDWTWQRNWVSLTQLKYFIEPLFLTLKAEVPDRGVKWLMPRFSHFLYNQLASSRKLRCLADTHKMVLFQCQSKTLS